MVAEYLKKSNIVRTLHDGLKIPVTAKIRILPTEEETLELVRRIEASGA
jgi:tRNA-dihydrouridine synthase 1